MRRSSPTRKAPLKSGRGFSASPEQRKKVKGLPCVVCGRSEDWDGIKVDPAHVVAKGLGGCTDADCVWPICRSCHNAFHDGDLDLWRVMATAWPKYKTEFDHATTHADPISVIQHMANARVAWREEAA